MAYKTLNFPCLQGGKEIKTKGNGKGKLIYCFQMNGGKKVMEQKKRRRKHFRNFDRARNDIIISKKRM